MNKDDIVTDFNSMLLDLAKNVADICPTSILGANIKDIEKQINKPSNRLKFIDLFCGKVLQYKDKIDSGDETFFLQKNYDDDLKDESALVGKVFEFKTIWIQLSDNNKNVVKQYMKILCALAQQYFMICIG